MGRRKKVVALISAVVVLAFAILAYFSVQKYRAGEINAPEAPKVTWTGAGTDDLCGGQLGSGNWWSCPLNWSTGVLPSQADDVIFDSSSSKNAVIDSLFPGAVNGITLYSNYGGTVTQQRDLSILKDFQQHGGVFNSNPTYQFGVGGSFYVADNQVSDGTVNAIRSDSQGNIYIGGTFTSISGLPIKYFAKFDGKKWSAVGDEFDNVINAIAVDSQDNVYVGGTFSKIGNLTVNGIAKWNGANWSDLAGGLTDGYGATPTSTTVKILVIDDQDRLYVGGTFESAGGVGRVNHIARWTGANWEKIGNGVGSTVTAANDGNSYLNGYVNNIIIENNSDPAAVDKDIYLGGSFSNICGNDLCNTNNTVGNHLIKYDGKTGVLSSLGGMKSAVGSMIFDSINRLTVYSGSGITSGSGSTCSIGYLENGVWYCHNTYGGSINRFIKINGVVYAGGTNNWPGALTNFNEAIKGAPNYNYYASSVPLGSGVDGTVYDLANVGGVLYAAGSFTGGIVKYLPAETNKAKQLVSPFQRSMFSRYSGDGTIGSAYQVFDVYGLQAAKLVPDKYYALANDIDGSTTTRWNETNGFLPIGTQMNAFSGNFQGNNHSINGLSLAGFDQYAGLFGYINKTGVVSGLNITQAALSSNKSVKYVGILAGKNLGLLSNINVSGAITINSPSSNPGQSIGGAVGYNTNLNYGTRAAQTGVPDYSPTVNYAVNDKVFSARVYVAIKPSIGVPVDNTTYWRGTGDVDVFSLSNITANVNITGTNISDVGGILGTQEKIAIKTGGYPYLYEASRIFEILSGLNSSGSIHLTNSWGNIGGLVGRQDYEFATIKDSVSSSSIELVNADATGILGNSTENIGGIAGYSFGPILNSHASGNFNLTVNGENIDLNNIGGVVGKIDNPSSLNPILDTSYSEVNIVINGSNGAVFGVGGLVGDSKIAPIKDSYSQGNITVDSTGVIRNIGGLAGSIFQSNITNSYSSNGLSVDNHTASNQLATGNIGGLAGLTVDSNIDLSKSTGSVTVNGDSSCTNAGAIGGLVGNFAGGPSYYIKRSFASGNISANCVAVGGLAGIAAGNIDQSFATGSTQGMIKVGGLVGYALGGGLGNTISNSFAYGDVTSNATSGTSSYTGGFLGFSRNTFISNSYSLGRVSGQGPSGGFVGAYDKRDSDFSKSFYLKDTDYNNLSSVGLEMVNGETGSGNNANAELLVKLSGISKSNFRIQSNFTDWDFVNTWAINNNLSYPYLKSFVSLSPVISTVAASNVAASTTTLNGNIENINGFKPYVRGFMYGTDTANPTIVILDSSNSSWNGDFGSGNYSAALPNLSSGNYSFRAFSASVGGTAFGAWNQFVVGNGNRKTGDINGDSKIDEMDFTLLLFNWGSNPGNHFADINADGSVSDSDFTILLYWWGK